MNDDPYLDRRQLDLALLRLPLGILVGRERHQMSFALLFLFAWAILGTIVAAAFAKVAGPC